MPSMPAISAQDIVEVADRLFAAIENSDVATVDRLWSDDIAVWRAGARRDNDKPRALRVIEWFVSATSQRRYELLDRQIFDDGSSRGFVQQHILHATGQAGQSIALRVCIVIKLDDNARINRIDEYFDPAGITPILDAS